jgi:hypothetical protein
MLRPHGDGGLSVNAKERNRLDRYLAGFRGEEKKSQVATVVDKPSAIVVLGVWAACAKDWRPKGRAPRDEFALWRWLWSCVWFDAEELAAVSGLSETEAARVLRMCMGLRLVYPDGSISKHAQQLLEDHGRSRRPGVAKGRPKGSKDRKARKVGSDDE